MKKKKFLLPALLMAACLALGGGLLTLDTTASAAEDSAVAAYCPDGSENVSLGKSVTVSSAYNMPNEGWSPAFLTDGSIGTLNQQPPNGWSTAIHETDVSTTPAWATVDLGGEYSISCIVLFPRRDLPGQYGESFPVGFRLEVSATGAEGSWKTVKEFTDLPRPTEPLVIDVTEATNANFVRLYVTKRTGVDDTSGGEHNSVGKLVQVSEMAVFGKLLHAVASLDRPALELAVGSSDTLKVNVSGMDAPAFTWTSDDASVASVDADGKVTANAVGKTVVRVSGEGIEEQTANISVVDKKYDFDENITISVFWLPTTTYLNGGEGDERWDEQFKLLADADIDWLANVTDNDNTGMLIHTNADNMKAAEYAA